MRRIFGVAGALGLTFVLAGTGRADEQADGMALVDRAIKAQGGLARLTKFPAFIWKTKGSFEKGVKVSITGDVSVQGLDHFRWDLEGEAQGQTIQGSMILAGKKGWFKAQNQPTQDMPADALTLLLEDLHAAGIAQRLWMLKDRAYRLAPLGELTIGKREAVGIKISRKGYADIDLYFDKQTMLPLKSSVRLKEGKDGEEAVHDFFYRDFKKTRGIQHFTRLALRRNDEKLIDVELTEVSLEEKLDATLFAKP